MTSKSRGRRGARSALGGELIKGLEGFRDAVRDGAAIERRFTVRTVAASLDPAPYSSRDVKALRARFQASQAIFARLLGVSVKTLQAWEQGSPIPPLARRLLDVMRRDPSPWRRLLHDSVVVRKAS